MTQSYLGDNLYTLRKQKGISQDEFAEKLGVSRQAVSKWERNEAYPDTENLIAISRFYGVSIDDLINTPIGESISPTADEEKRENGNDTEEDKEQQKKRGFGIWYSLPYPIIITVIYLLLGFFTPRGWEIGWTLYVTIPVYYSIIDCIRRKKLTPFAYPVFVTFIFLLFGMLYGIWHPLWIIYTTISIYYPVASAIDRANNNKRK